jgi:primosomal protein N' (replication factor Y)
MLASLQLPDGAEVLGPVIHPPTATPTAGPATPAEGEPPQARVVVRVPKAWGGLLSRALLAAQGVRSARKLPLVRVQVDPGSLG